MGAYFLGPRHMRFDDNLQKVLQRQFNLGHNVSMQAIGTLILWFGWYGFNCGSTLAAAGAMELASKVAVNTTLAAASGGIIVATLERYTVARIWCVPSILNGVLGGLVSITAPCAVVKPGELECVSVLSLSSCFHIHLPNHFCVNVSGIAIPIGLIGGILYMIYEPLRVLRIDCEHLTIIYYQNY